MTTPTTVKPPLSARDVADFTGRHVETVYLWIKTGKLRACRAGANGNWIIKASDLDEALRVQPQEERSTSE